MPLHLIALQQNALQHALTYLTGARRFNGVFIAFLVAAAGERCTPAAFAQIDFECNAMKLHQRGNLSVQSL
jgi:hypothetical protein